jgi:hypothetical protein
VIAAEEPGEQIAVWRSETQIGSCARVNALSGCLSRELINRNPAGAGSSERPWNQPRFPVLRLRWSRNAMHRGGVNAQEHTPL